MKKLLCSLLLLVAALQAVGASPETKWKEIKTEFATFKIPDNWDVPGSNVHFGIPIFEGTNANGKTFKITNKSALYLTSGTEAFLTVSRYFAESGNKATMADVKSFYDRQISYRSEGKGRIIWMSVGKDAAKGVATISEIAAVNGKWVYNRTKYIVFVHQIGSDVYVVETHYSIEKAGLTDEEYNQLTQGVFDSLRPIN